jgi:hypothetical protein
MIQKFCITLSVIFLVVSFLLISCSNPIASIATVDNPEISTKAAIMTTLQPGVYNDNNAAIVYSGFWGIVAGDIPVYGGDYRRCLYKNSYYQFKCNGVNTKIYAVKDSWSGIANIYIDGHFKRSIDLYSPNTLWQTLIYSTSMDNIPAGIHTIKVVNSGRKNIASNSTYISLDKLMIFDNIVIVSPPPNGVSFPCSTSVTLSIGVTGVLPQYQWQLSTDQGASFYNVTKGFGGTTANYHTPNNSPVYNGYLYRCIVSNDAPSSVISNNVYISMTGTCITYPDGPGPNNSY